MIYYIDRQREGIAVKVGFIGAGRVGCSTAVLLKEAISLSGFYSRRRESAEEAAFLMDSRAFTDIKALCGESDIVFITTPDGAVNSVWNGIKEYMGGKIVCHMSGVLSAEEAFPDSEIFGVKSASIHPLMAVSDKKASYKKLRNAFFTAEGSAAKELCEIFEKAGCSVKRTEASFKKNYHAAAVIASNLTLSLLKMSCEELEKCGFSESEALEAIKPLAMGNLENLFEKGFENSLTGPLERCDTETVKKHLASLTGDTREVYKKLSGHLLGTAKRKNPGTDYSALEEELQT